MTARTVMVQGTASSVGKSLIVTALCRLFHRANLRVAPFKAQNMALNSAVAEGGGEIGRAQAVQAEAAGIAPSVDMNPILLKPEGDSSSQVVVMGRAIGSMRAGDYHARKPDLRGVIADALARLRARVDVVVIEGAGSPAEVNLKDRDIVNMHVARAADAPVLLVGDIDRGGVFAALVGTMELLDPDERALVAAFLVNKFRGDRRLLEPGLEFLERRCGVPVLGVVPYVRDLRIADEDSVSLDERSDRRAGAGELEIAVVRLPRISNFDDLEPLEHEAGVVVRYVTTPEDLATADLVVLPGSKCTVADLRWLRERGMAAAVTSRAARGAPVLGICGGCQMLGAEILDPEHVESDTERTVGLELLPVCTRFQREKTTAQVQGRLAAPSFLGAPGTEVSGYEIHMGTTELRDGAVPTVEIASRNGVPCRELDGAIGPGGAVVGTLVHGLFENASVRAALLRSLRARRGMATPERPLSLTLPPQGEGMGVGRAQPASSRAAEYDRLARAFLEAIDWPLLCRVVGIDPLRRPLVSES